MIGIRKAEYQAFSEHAAHLTCPALRMLQLPSGDTQLGPRPDAVVLRQCLHELGRRVLLAVVCKAKVLMMLHRRDGQQIPSNVEDRMTQIRSEGMRIYTGRTEDPPTSDQ